MGKISVDESHKSIVRYKQQNLNENIRFIIIQLHGAIQVKRLIRMWKYSACLRGSYVSSLEI